MRILIMGAPGAGKGTQATRIAEHYDIPAISTGAIFRSNIAEGTELGLKAKAIMDSGELVPDEITEEIVADRLNEEDAEDGWLLDGFPRTMHQARALDETLKDTDQELDAVISLDVNTDLLVERLLARALFEGRSDDNEETIRTRMAVYTRETQPLLNHYDRQGLVIALSGEGTVDEVTERIFEALDELDS